MTKMRPSPGAPPPLQFGLGTMLAVVALFCLLFGVLSWFGLTGTQLLVGFGGAVGGAIAAALCVEFARGIRRLPTRPTSRPTPPRADLIEYLRRGRDLEQGNNPYAQPPRVLNDEMNGRKEGLS